MENINKSIYSISSYIPGDCVKVKYGEAKGKVGIVSNSYISTNNKMLTLMIFVGNDFKNSKKEDWITAFSDDVEPIPLTMEILEKNGFTVGNYNEWSNHCCSFLHFVIDNFEKNEWGVYVRKTADEIHLTTIRYVHELQHLLYTLDVHCNIVL